MATKTKKRRPRSNYLLESVNSQLRNDGPRRILVVGAGGAACSALPVLFRQMCHSRREGDELIIMDGDVYEDKNVLRQFPAAGNSGVNKAEAWAQLLEDQRPDGAEVGLSHVSAYMDEADGTLPPDMARPTLIWVMVDNHPARRAAVAHARRMSVPVISAANESRSAEAWLWLPVLEGSPADPFVWYPEMLSATDNSPLHREHCTDTAVIEASPQTPASNMMAATAGMMLFNTAFGDGGVSFPFTPCHVRLERSHAEVRRIGDLLFGDQPGWEQEHMVL